jgi:hypothetical protein
VEEKFVSAKPHSGTQAQLNPAMAEFPGNILSGKLDVTAPHPAACGSQFNASLVS